MNTKKAGFRFALGMALCLVCGPVAHAGARVLVVPARYSVLQVALDVAARHGAALVSYQGEVVTEAPLLHYWNGAEWIRLSLDDYAHARFVQSVPKTVVLVGGSDMLPPVLESVCSAWCGDVRVVPSVDTPALLNAMGVVFSFSPHEWRWFARRYNLQLRDENEERRRSWYDKATYEDEWSERWSWLRRKHNEQEPAAPAEAAEVGYEEAAPQEIIIPPWPEPTRYERDADTRPEPPPAPAEIESYPVK